MNKNLNYLKQISVLKMKSKETLKTFASFSKVFPISESNENKDLPFEWVAGASRINFSIIEKKETVKVCDVNLTTDEINDLYDQTKSLYTYFIGTQMGFYSQSTSLVDNSPCYVETFKLGTLKGKTPAQVRDADTLKKQKDFLAQNIAKYPENQKLINAIDDCLNKIKDGSLSQKSTSGIVPFEMINEQEKSRIKIKDENGNSAVTGIRIACDFTRRLPICVTITNSFAPVQVASDGRLIVQASKTINKKEVYVNLTIKDWNMFISRCKEFIIRYENYLAPQMFKLVEKYEWKPCEK